jgi:L-2,4-diaminobutyrate decarboxylase
MSGIGAEERELTEGLFLGSEQGTSAYQMAMEQAQQAVTDAHVQAATPYSGLSHDQLAEWFDGVECLPDEGKGLTETIETVSETILRHSVGVSHPACIAHLQCPPMIPALAAEAMISASNQSMDSWDQSPAATELETNLIETLTELFGYEEQADGVFTSGGTQSNFMGLLLARNWYLDERFDHDVQVDGLPSEADSLRVLCSEDAHFTAQQATAQLGLGESAVVTVATDDEYRLSIDALDSTLQRLYEQDLQPFALIGTAGTTDFGSIDPLSTLADRANENELWFHVDAAYGGALALSDRHREKLTGIAMADSIAVDFHKLFYQPISCGAFLLQNGSHYQFIDRNAAYLNPDDATGVPNLVSKSVQTTRRFDALKPFIAFQTVGRKGMAELIDYTLSLATSVAARIAADPRFDLKNEPTLNAVVFRYLPSSSTADDPAAWTSEVNRQIRDRLLSEESAVVARTTVDDDTYLKFTLLNPRTTVAAVEYILETIKQYGEAITEEREETEDTKTDERWNSADQNITDQTQRKKNR